MSKGMERAKALLLRVRTLTESPVTLKGSTLEHFEGPGGEWTLRAELRNRWQYVFTPPPTTSFTKTYSFNSLNAMLISAYFGLKNITMAEPVFSELPAVPLSRKKDEGEHDVLLLDIEYDDFHHLAATVIQARYRYYIVWKINNSIAVVSAELQRMEAQRASVLEELDVLKTLKVDARSNLMQIVNSVDKFPHHDALCIAWDKILDTVLPRVPAFQLMYNETAFKTENIKEYAVEMMKIKGVTENEHAHSKAIFKADSVPIIMGQLPLPIGTKRVWIRSKQVYVTETDQLSMLHSKLLRKAFCGDGWHSHVKQCLDDRALNVYDFYSEKPFSKKSYMGSCILSKWLVRDRCEFKSAIHVESICCSMMNKGFGKLMIAFCKKLAFTDTNDISTGIIFAQCVKNVSFWDFFDVTNQGKILVLQMNKMFDCYDIEEECITRSLVIRNVRMK